MSSGPHRPIYVPPLPAPESDAGWHPMLDDLETFEEGRGPDEIEVVPHPATVLTPDGHEAVTEFYVTVPSAGVVAVLRPLDEDVAAGEGVLVAEHLRRRAEEVREEIARVRRAFRSALGSPQPSPFLRPFHARRRVEDGLEALQPSVANVMAALLLGVGLGVGGAVAGEQVPALGYAGAGASAAVLAYALVGLWRSGGHRSAYRRTVGLPVRIRTSAADEEDVGPAPAGGARRPDGPHAVEAEIRVHQHRNEVRVEPRALVLDAAGRRVEVFTGGDEGDPAERAGRAVREAYALADDLPRGKAEALQVAEA